MKTASIFLIIIAALFGAYVGSNYLKKALRPKESLGRLLLFMLSCLLMVFVLSFIMVFVIARLFPHELIR